MSTDKLPLGYFTPHAAVLCAGCFGNAHTKLEEDEYLETCRPMPQPDFFDGRGTCDRCKRGCWLTGDVAACQRAAEDLCARGHKASLAQTGGMCCPVHVQLPDGTYFLVGPDDDEPNHYTYEFHDSDGEFLEGSHGLISLDGLSADIRNATANATTRLRARKDEWLASRRYVPRACYRHHLELADHVHDCTSVGAFVYGAGSPGMLFTDEQGRFTAFASNADCCCDTLKECEEWLWDNWCQRNWREVS